MSDDEDIVVELERYFSTIFSSINPSSESLFDVLRLVENRVTGAMNESLDAHFSTEEIKAALFGMDGCKAPRLDGFQAMFFQ